MDTESGQTTAAGPITPARPGRRVVGRACHYALWGIAVAVFLALLAGGAGVALFAHGPVELAAVERAARDVLADLAGPQGGTRLGAARLDWSWSAGLTVALTDVGVDRGPGLSVDVPRATIRLAMLPVLIGEVKPRTLAFADPRIRLDLTGPAPVGDAPAQPTPAQPTSSAPAAVPVAPAPVVMPMLGGEERFRAAAETAGNAVAGIVEAARAAGLRSLAVTGGTVETLRRDAGGQIRHAFVEDVSADATVGGAGGALDVTVSARGEVGRWTARATLAEEPDRRRHLTAVITDLGQRDLFGPPSPTFSVGMPFDARIGLSFAGEKVDGADVVVRAAAGVLRFGPEPDDEVLIDEGEMNLVWRPEAHDFRIAKASVGIGETALAFTGRLGPPPAGNGRWAVDLTLDRGRFGPRDVPGPAMTVDSADIGVILDTATRKLEIRRAKARFGGGGVDAAGILDFSGPEPKLGMDLAFPPLTVDQVRHAWPHWVAPEARRWFIDNAGAGRVSDLAISLDLPRMDKFETWPNDAVKLSARFDGLRFRVFGALPEIAAAEGRLTIADRRFEVAVDRAAVATTHAPKRPNVDGFRLLLPDMFTKAPKASFRFQVSGEVPAVAEIVNAEPLSVLDQTGIKLDGLAGTAAITGQIDMVLSRHIDPATIDWKIDAAVERFANTQPIQGKKFQDGKFRITSDTKGTRITGRAQVEGIGADIDLYEPNGSVRTAEKRDFKMVLDEAARQRLGLDLGSVLQGAIGVAVSQSGGNETRRRIEVDLTPAKVVLAPFGWTKSSGVPAKAVFDQVDDDKGSRIENLVAESEGLAIRGSAQFDKDKRLVGVDLGKFALRRGDDSKVKLTRGSDGIPNVVFDGAAFDLRGLLLAQRRSGPPAAGEKGPDLNLKIRIAKLTGFNDTDLGDVGTEVQIRDGVVTVMRSSARASGGRSVTIQMKPEGGGRRLVIGADDAGAVLSFLDVFDRIKGGTLTFNAFLPAPGESQGLARISDFSLLEEPKSGRVAAPQATAGGTRRIAVRRAEFDRSTDFDRAQARFAMKDGTIEVTEAIAKGKSVGATASGQLDVGNQRVALTGTYIPAFGLNNLAGQIPIIGAITGAGSNGGLVGVTFRVSGAIDDPILEINPLSAIAPGIFRRIFEFQSEDTGPRGDPNAPTKITP